MLKAIEKSIYYADINNFTSPVITFEYSDEESFINIIKELHNYIEVIAIFGTKDNICYDIFNHLSYTDLLFDKTTSVYLVNRKDNYIRLNRKSNEMNEKERIAILKIDSVLSEYRTPEYKTSSIKPYFLYPMTFLLGGVTSYFLLKELNI